MKHIKIRKQSPRAQTDQTYIVAPHTHEEYELTTVDLSDFTLAAREQAKDKEFMDLTQCVKSGYKEIPGHSLGDRRDRFLQHAMNFAFLDIGNGEKAIFYHPITPPKGSASLIPVPPRFVVPGRLKS